MKKRSKLLSVIIGLAAMSMLLSSSALLSGCRTRQPHQSKQQERRIQAALGKESQRVLDDPPAITPDTQWAAVCPWCGTINISKSCMTSGSSTVQVGIPVEGQVILTNVTVGHWTISFICRNCEQPYADYRDQRLPSTRAIMLPIRSSSERGSEMPPPPPGLPRRRSSLSVPPSNEAEITELTLVKPGRKQITNWVSETAGYILWTNAPELDVVTHTWASTNR